MISTLFKKESLGHTYDKNLPGENPNRHPGPGGESEGNYFPEELEPPIGDWDGWADNIDWGAAGTAFAALCFIGIVCGAFYLATRKSKTPSLGMGTA